MEHYLLYLAPPLVGAFIGFMTNHIAIRMLFRPLKPWRIFGIRVPMTPGVIPSKRHDLAQNIGTMVGHHLLTSEDISKALSGAGFTKELQSVVNGRVTTILEKDRGPLATIIPKRFHSYFAVSIKVLRGRALKFIHDHLDSQAFAIGLAETIIVHIDEFLAKDVNNIIPEKSWGHLFLYLETTIKNLLGSPNTGKWINSYIDKELIKIMAEKKSLQDLLPSQLITIISSKIAEEAPSLLAKAAEMVHEPQMQDRLTKGICRAIESFIAGLGPMAALAGSFLSPEIIDKKVREYLDEKGDDISNWLIDEKVRQRIAQILQDKVTEFVSTPIPTLLKNVPEDRMSEIWQETSRQLTALIQNPNLAETISSVMKEAIQTQTDRPLQDTLNDLFSPQGVMRGKEWTAEEIINIIRSPKVKRILDNIVTTLMEENILNRSIGPIANFLPQKVQIACSEYLLQVTSELLINEVPSLVDSLNIQKIVSKKVDSLDLMRLEDLLMGIMQEQFKYINLFGGLLGFIIGLCNLAFLI